jgi:DNA-binding IclR family transcriptional regulator
VEQPEVSMKTGQRWTENSLAILALLDSHESLHLYAVAKTIGLRASHAHTILMRLTGRRLATRAPEALLVKPGMSAGQPRVLYRITDAGRTQLTVLRSLIARRVA